MRQECAARRAEERADGRLGEAEGVEEREQLGARDEPEGDDDAGAQQVGRQHDRAAVPSVDVHPGDEADGEGRHRLGDRHQRDGDGGATGQVVDDQQDEQQRDAVADVGDDLAGEEVSVVADAEDVADPHRRVGHRSVLLVGCTRIEGQDEPVVGAAGLLEVVDLGQLLDLAHHLADARVAQPGV